MASDHWPVGDAGRTGLVEAQLMAKSLEHVAEEVLAHSEAPDEWEDEPVQIERRPSGTQVISARLPSDLAEQLLSEAARRGLRASDLVREGVEQLLSARPSVAALKATGGAAGGIPVRILTPVSDYSTENPNLVVEEPRSLVALGPEVEAKR